MNKWPQIPVDETTDLEKIIPFIKPVMTSHRRHHNKKVDELQAPR